MNDTIEQTITSAHYALFNRFAHQVNNLGMNLVILDKKNTCIFQAEAAGFTTPVGSLTEAVSQAFAALTAGIQSCGPDERFIYCVLEISKQPVAVAFLDHGPAGNTLKTKLRDYCGRNGLNEQELFSIISNTPTEQPGPELLKQFASEFASAARHGSEVEKLTFELSQTYEQIVLMYNLSTHMKVTQTNAEFLQYACDQLTSQVSVEGLAIYLEKKVEGQKRLVLTAGCGYISIDAQIADILQVHLASELSDGKEALVDSNIYGPFKYIWPDNVRNILAVPLQGQDKIIGLLVATNIHNKSDFDSSDIKLFNSVANQCAVFIENGRLFADLKELFIGSLKALTNSIDAKDQYTRGHSERVAFISRWIAEHLQRCCPIPPELIHHVYLAGLLHDIGKIGVSELVLRKRDKLTEEEHAVIVAHPRIGASILSEIAQMRCVVPGVLHHHERYDGKGYPQRLAGEDIPLIGRIIALADTFDAMTSKRVYRDAMSLKRALLEIEKNIGTQFDPQIAKVFLESDIEKLWHIIQDGFIETWDYSNFSEYGAVAVGALIR